MKPTLMQTCVKCNENKPKYAEFSYKKDRATGSNVFKATCKTCASTAPTVKKCSKCEEQKQLTEYYARSGGRLRSECKCCYNARTNKREIKAKVVEPVRDERWFPWLDLGMEYRREIYDPYSAANRYEGRRV